MGFILDGLETVVSQVDAEAPKPEEVAQRFSNILFVIDNEKPGLSCVRASIRRRLYFSTGNHIQTSHLFGHTCPSQLYTDRHCLTEASVPLRAEHQPPRT